MTSPSSRGQPESFNDALLDDEAALAAADPVLLRLAEAGSRVRREAESSGTIAEQLAGQGRPRAVVAAGADARLLRAVLEPWCPVPFVAWPGPGLPGWAGALDLVVVLAPTGGTDPGIASAIDDAVRRGCTLIVACPPHSELAELAAGRNSLVLGTETEDGLAVAVALLQLLHVLELGPELSTESVAQALDEVAVRCSPRADLASNPGKDLALVLADTLPLVWGGSVLSARAGRRVAEALRQASGRAALAADADHLFPVIEGAPAKDLFADLFADPFADPTTQRLRPALIVLDDGSEAPTIRSGRTKLLAAAESNDVRSQVLVWDEGPEVARYAALHAMGTYAAVYLAIGLGRYSRREQ